MSDYAEIVTLVEGPTERIFITELLTPYLAGQGILMTPIIISKPGAKGGDVRFARVRNDIERHLKQRGDTYLTLFVDFYGIKSDWPGLAEAKQQVTPSRKSTKINQATKKQINLLFGTHRADRRFIPYFAMHEFEAMLFSEPQKLAELLCVPRNDIDNILRECGEPENINDSPMTAPSKRLESLSGSFKKTVTGITIARAIGLAQIRKACPIFNEWLTTVEKLK